MKVKTLNKTKSNNSEVIIKDEIFGIDPNEDVILRVLNWQLAKKQQGNHKVKSRSEVKSTTAKMYRQKGGGRARHGASSVVQFRGGGVVHGPVPRSHAHKLPKKIRVLGLKSALSQKAKNNNVLIFNIDKISKKTSEIVKTFSKEGIKKVLLVLGKDDKQDDLNLAIRNIPLADTINQIGLNVYDVLKKDHILFTEQGLKEFEDRLSKWLNIEINLKKLI